MNLPLVHILHRTSFSEVKLLKTVVDKKEINTNTANLSETSSVKKETLHIENEEISISQAEHF